MTLLVVDVGNTRSVIGVVDGGSVVERWQVTTTRRTADEWELLLRSLLAGAGSVPDAAAMASVVPEATRVLRVALPAVTATEPVVVGPGVKTGMPIDVDNIREVGADRVAGAVGAADRFGSPVLAVGFGTATTVDLVDGAGRFRGGAIAVGVEVAAEALVDSTSALRRVELGLPAHAVGRSTVEAVRSGTIHGFAGLVDGLVSKMSVEAGVEGCPVVATGGFADLVAPHCASVTDVDTDLTLWGLALIHRRNT